MSSVEEDVRKIMNLDPFADPFLETFDPATDSLEAIRGAIDGLEAGIFAYGITSGPQEVEINDKADFEVVVLNPGGDIVPLGSITPGTYYISRIQNGTKTPIHNAAAVAADGKVTLDTPYEFTSPTWSPGDLVEVKFTGIETDIGGTVTKFPDMILQGRVVRDEEITDKLGALDVTENLKALLGDLDTTTPKQLGNILGGLTHTDNLKAILGNLTTTKNLGGILGGFTTTNNLYDLLGTFTPTENLKDILGNLTTTKNLGGILGGLDITENLKALLGDLDTTTPKQLGNILGGLTHTDNLKAILGAFTATENLKAIMGDLSTTKKLGQILGGFDEGADPQGSLFLALGIGTTYSVWDAIQYIHHAAVSTPTAGSLAQVLAEDIYGRTNNKTLNALLGVVDGAGKSIGGNLGDFQANTNLQSLLAVLGGGWETANKDMYTLLYTDLLGHATYGLAALDTDLDAILADVGDASASTLGSLLAILGDPATALETRIGNPDAHTLTSLVAKFGDLTEDLTTILETFVVAEAGGLGDRIAFIQQFIGKGTGTVIAANKSLYDAIGLVLGRVNDPSIMDMLGFPDAANGSLYERLGTFTNANNLKALLGAGFTPANNLYDILGGYISTDTLKDHIDVLKVDDISLVTIGTRSMADYVRGIGSNRTPDGFDSATVTANEDGSVFERLEDLKQLLDDNITDGTFITVNDVAEHTVATFTAHRTGELAVQLDLDELITAVEGGTVTVRLKHMIDNATRRIIDKATFIVGTDEVHPNVQGWVDKNNANGVEVTIQCSVAPTAGRNVPYKVMEAT